ncbi:MAG: cation diffusion facilitator family transporter [Thermaerobacter sp.]|nr:cation diffusion facilitator family transporter [Thermaerobacter sp.]
MEHRHAHSGAQDISSGERFLGTAFLLALIILLVEVAGGYFAHSLALLSDAGHMLTDVLALGAARFSARIAHRPPTGRWSYGFHRAGILAALFNASTLLVVSGAILVEAISRIMHPVPVQGGIMFAAAAVGLVGNLYVGLRLEGGHHHENLNVRSAWLHVMSDAAASGAVLLGGLIIAWTGWRIVDPVVSVLISVLILRGAWSILRETVAILMEGVPDGIDQQELLDALCADSDIRSCHHLHVWSLGSGQVALSAHLVLGNAPLAAVQTVVERAAAMLQEKFGIDHCTFQAESEGEPCVDGDDGCA